MSPPSPFARCGGRTYLVANFSLAPTEASSSLHDLLAKLLQEHNPGEILLLRPLGVDEAKELHDTREDADIDCWARIVGRKG